MDAFDKKKEIIDNAIDMSHRIATAEQAYRTREAQLKVQMENMSSLPFITDSYKCVVVDGSVFVEGWHGDMSINKLYHYDGQMYRFLNPIIMPDVSFYGKIGRDGYTEVIVNNKPITFHGYSTYVYEPYNLHAGCLGNTTVKGQWTLKQLQAKCLEVVGQLSVVFMSALYKIHRPNNCEHEEMIKFIDNMGDCPEDIDKKQFDKYFKLM
jgi:hypothetical protein